MKESDIELTILMPCLNEEETIGICIEKAKTYLKENNINGEVLISDNGSTDRSVEIAEKMGARVCHETVKGYGSALIRGTKEARGKYIIMGDCDDSYDFLNLNDILSGLRNGYELVMGNRFKGGIEKGAMPLYIYLVYNQENNSELTWKETLKLVIETSIIWFLGYALTWLSKWAIYDLIYHEGLIKSAIEQVLYRTTRDNIYAKYNILETIAIMILDKLIYFIILLGAILIFLKNRYKIQINFKNKKNYLIENIPLLFVSAMPLVWYIILSNHTLIHTIFVYRHLLIFFIGILLSFSGNRDGSLFQENKQDMNCI